MHDVAIVSAPVSGMRKSIRSIVLLFSALACLTALAAVRAQTARRAVPADIILTNGKIFTSNAARPYIRALAIRGDRITAVGDSATITALAGPETRRIDLGGRMVIAGINDAHYHFAIGPDNAVHLQFRSFDPSWEEVKASIVSAAAQKPKGTFIRGGIGRSVFADPAANRKTLDEISPGHPVILTTFTGHAIIANSAALAAAAIPENEKDPIGTRFERFPDGKLSGVLREYACLEMVRNLADRTSDDDAVTQLRKTLHEAARVGITSFQDMSNAMPPERAVRLLQRVPTDVRVRIMRMPMTTGSGRDTQEGLPRPAVSNPLLTVSGTKWMLDGSPLEGTFLPRTDLPPLSQDSDLELIFPRSELPAMLRESLKDDDQLLLHVGWHPAAAAMMQALAQTGGAHVWAARRVRFEHGDGLTRDLLPPMKEMGIVVVQNPTHLDTRDIVPGFGDLTIRYGLQPLRSLLAAGIPLAFGSDSDGPTNPYLDIMFAVTDPNNPSEALTREQAVIAYTATSAYAEFKEKDKGTLEPGKLADLAVLSHDIFAVPLPDVPKTVSVLTMVGGKIVYDAGVVHAVTDHAGRNRRDDSGSTKQPSN